MAVHRPEEFFARLGRHQLIGFGEAYLTGAWDAEDLGGFLTVLAAEMPTWCPSGCSSCAAWSCASPRRAELSSAENSQRQHRPPLRPVERPLRALPRPHAELLLRALHRRASSPPAPDRAASSRPGPQDRAAARPGRRQRGHPGARDRVRLGRAGHPRRPPRRDGPHHHALDRAEGPGRRADRRRRLLRPGRRRACRLPRRRGHLRRRGVGRDDRGGRLEFWPTYFETIDRVLAPGGRVGDPGHHDAPRPDAGHPQHLHLDQQVHLPRRLPALGAGDRRDHPRRHRAAHDRAASRWARPTPRRCGCGTRRSWPPPSGCSASASTRPSCGCGTSTSSTPAPASPRATSTSTSSPSPGTTA